MAMCFYLSIDIESEGDALHNPVNGIGIFLGPVEQTTPPIPVFKKRWALAPLPGDVADPGCIDDFWSKFPHVHKWLKDNARPASEVLLELREYCRQVVRAAGPRNITILTDCPDFDLGRLDYLGHRTGTWDRPIRFLDSGVRHSQADPSERLEQLGPGAEADFETWLQKHAPHAKHTHFPDDDAEHSYYQMLYCDSRRPRA